MYYKKLEDGSISCGPTVYAPSFTLDKPGMESVDGWVWMKDEETALQSLGLNEIEILEYKGELTKDKAYELIKAQMIKEDN